MPQCVLPSTSIVQWLLVKQSLPVGKLMSAQAVIKGSGLADCLCSAKQIEGLCEWEHDSLGQTVRNSHLRPITYKAGDLSVALDTLLILMSP